MDVKKSLVWLLLLTALGYMSLRVLFMPGYVSILRYGTDDITITRDQFNIPHVKAPNRNAAYYGVGYATAEDRLFQMHMKKMISQGRLSQMFGERSLVVDKIFRTLGLGYWANEADKRVHSCMIQFKVEDPIHYAAYEAFSQGINDYVQNRAILSIEFYLIWSDFESWRPMDCISVNSLLTYSQAMDLGGEFIRGYLSSNYTMAQIDELLPSKEEHVLDPLAVIFNDEELKAAGYFQEYKSTNRTIANIQPEHIDKLLDVGSVEFANTMEASASNSWVISGNLTKSGKPILANDPHLEVTIPSEWYQFAMEYVSTNGKVRTYKGAAITGGLNSLIGRTHYIAWGCTNVYTDTIDLYKEQLDETKTHYLFDGVMRKLKIRNEIIKVKGQPDVEFELKFTHRGPLLPYVNFWTHVYQVKEPISMAWTNFHSSYRFSAEVMEIFEIDTFEELKQALSTSFNDAPSINLVFITNDGHIGLQVIGQYPIAPYQQEMGGFVKDGTTSKYDWVGMLRGKDRLQITDPAKGYIVTANNRLASKNFRGGRYASNWLITARAIRISEMIQHKIDNGHKLTIEDSKQIQLDTVDVFCRKVASHLTLLDPEFKRLLDGWDCNFKHTSHEASIYSMFIYLLQKKLKPASVPIEGHHFFNHFTYKHILKTTTDDVDNATVIRQTLKDTKKKLEEWFMSSNESSWVWGKLHTDYMEHRPFSRSPFARVFERISPGRGNENTPNVGLMRKLPEGDWSTNHRAGIRTILTFEEGKSEWIVDSGSSENIFSSKDYSYLDFYDDQFKLFQNDKYIPFDSLPKQKGSAEL